MVFVFRTFRFSNQCQHFIFIRFIFTVYPQNNASSLRHALPLCWEVKGWNVASNCTSDPNICHYFINISLNLFHIGRLSPRLRNVSHNNIQIDFLALPFMTSVVDRTLVNSILIVHFSIGQLIRIGTQFCCRREDRREHKCKQHCFTVIIFMNFFTEVHMCTTYFPPKILKQYIFSISNQQVKRNNMKLDWLHLS